MTPNPSDIFILGLTTVGRQFRPSDWADRLSGCLSSFGDDSRLVYSRYVRPALTVDGVRCVVVNRELRNAQPVAFNFLMNFAKDNSLQVLDCEVDACPITQD
jgi:hypothetical protein